MATAMDTQCPTVATVQNQAPSSSSQPAASPRVASESAEARERRIRARRRERLASERAEEKESLALSSMSSSRQSTAWSPLDQRGTPRADARPARHASSRCESATSGDWRLKHMGISIKLTPSRPC